MFADYLDRWELTPVGEPVVTHSSRLLPVRRYGVAAMLKIALTEREKVGGVIMSWWGGDRAARVLARDGAAILLEWAENNISLADLARNGRDDEASRIMCEVIAGLHAPRPDPPGGLLPLDKCLEGFESTAAGLGGILVTAAAAAKDLLAAPQDVVVLHGDIHHDNILHFGARGWLAIDSIPGLGERGFDYANIFCNPDSDLALAGGRLARQATVIAEAAGLERRRLLQWVLSYAGWSVTWLSHDPDEASLRLAVAEAAAAELN
ncbi:aminoglycoside phosphotransferase family protein [Methylocystis sp. ATCC 49242]|uniref:aminoglycoside phosphotransferase family protein n=1 Tax=Methylocystis sp. ATCC 49242 TaxID=622637 RepID=UPI0005699862|nr:aminoglycoside phosphotransferase family protein [Methylocystis sp. ATCC 49242]